MLQMLDLLKLLGGTRGSPNALQPNDSSVYGHVETYSFSTSGDQKNYVRKLYIGYIPVAFANIWANCFSLLRISLHQHFGWDIDDSDRLF
jgi:hypothetical protein